jgi:hypothetical protein
MMNNSTSSPTNSPPGPGFLPAANLPMLNTIKPILDGGAVARQFPPGGDFVSAAPYGSGHINDTYFKVHREGHNLDRCRTQFKLVESLQQQLTPMARLVEAGA